MNEEIEVTIRKATIEDIPYVIQMASDVIGSSISPCRNVSVEEAREYRKDDLKDLATWLEPDIPAFIFVAETEEGEICGHVIFVFGSFNIISETVGWILDITVSTRFRGTGLSRKLHCLVETILKDKNVDGIYLSVTSSNERAVSFYKKLGYLEEHLCLLKIL